MVPSRRGHLDGKQQPRDSGATPRTGIYNQTRKRGRGGGGKTEPRNKKPESGAEGKAPAAWKAEGGEAVASTAASRKPALLREPAADAGLCSEAPPPSLHAEPRLLSRSSDLALGEIVHQSEAGGGEEGNKRRAQADAECTWPQRRASFFSPPCLCFARKPRLSLVWRTGKQNVPARERGMGWSLRA